MICRKLKIIPLEVVTRNRLAGSTAKKLGKSEGTKIAQPLVEFYYKDDALGDPFISDDQALLMGAVDTCQDLEVLKKLALEVNRVLQVEFARAGLELIDFKLEFGRDSSGKIVLGDEVSPTRVVCGICKPVRNLIKIAFDVISAELKSPIKKF